MDGHIALPEGPGLGVVPDEALFGTTVASYWGAMAEGRLGQGGPTCRRMTAMQLLQEGRTDEAIDFLESVILTRF